MAWFQKQKSGLDKRWFAADGGLMSPNYLRSLGFSIETVIDVGVDRGTNWLYDAYPDKQFLLVDPQPGCEEKVEKRPRNYQFFAKGVGAEKGQIELEVRGAKSTMIKRTASLPGKGRMVKVEIDTLDNIIDASGAKGPFGIKIDTEGFELDVLRGLTKHADDTSFIICEASIRRQYDGGYLFSELASYLRTKNFEFYNFISPHKLRPAYHDCLFVRGDSALFDWEPLARKG